MSSGLQWSVRLASGVRLTMLPPGVSAGAESVADCFRIYRRDQRSGRGLTNGGLVINPSYWKQRATLGLKKGVYREHT